MLLWGSRYVYIVSHTLSGQDTEFDGSGSLLSASMKRVKGLAQAGHNRWMCYMIIFILVVFFLVYYIIKWRSGWPHLLTFLLLRTVVTFILKKSVLRYYSSHFCYYFIPCSICSVFYDWKNWWWETLCYISTQALYTVCICIVVHHTFSLILYHCLVYM